MRPRSKKRIILDPEVTYFKPRGVPLHELEIIRLTLEECEALRLKNVLGYDQELCAQHMKTSQSTVQRLLTSVYRKIADALVHGKAIRIVTEHSSEE